MFELGKKETLIHIKQENCDSGFISFFTTNIRDWTRLCKRIGQENLFDVEKITKGVQLISVSCKIPIEFYRKPYFGISKKRRPDLKAPERCARLGMKNRKSLPISDETPAIISQKESREAA